MSTGSRSVASTGSDGLSFLVGGMIPSAIAAPPEPIAYARFTPRSRGRLSNVEEEFRAPRGVSGWGSREALSKIGSREEAEALPPCDPIPVAFSGICVDITIHQVEEQQGIFRRVLDYIGLGDTRRTGTTQRILHHITGVARPSRLIAVMGASGAGKSTLLNVLSKRMSPSEGVVTYAGVVPNEAAIKRTTAFVQQLDLFLNNLTVNEHLRSQIRLRLPRSSTAAQRKSRLEVLLGRLSLARCQFNRIGRETGVGGISGGERKRLNVASEIATLPSILFADEPTTGLDAFMAETVVMVLRDMAQAGRLVIATVHQPSSKIFELFDDLLVLSEGRLIYFGERLGSIEWFKRLGFHCPPFSNAADFIIKTLAMPDVSRIREAKLQQIIEWAARWNAEGKAFLEDWDSRGRDEFLTHTSDLIDKTPSERVTPSISQISQKMSGANTQASLSMEEIARRMQKSSQERLNWFQQVGVLFWRAVAANRRDKFLVQARALQTTVLALVYGFLMFRLSWSVPDSQTRIGASYTLSLNQAMASTFAVLHTFIDEKPVIRREYESGLISSSAYVFAKILADTPVQVIFPIVFSTVVFWLTNLADEFGRYIVVVLLVVLVSNAATSVGYFASAIAEGPDTASVFCNLMTLPLTIFGGFLVKLDQAPRWLSWIQYISFVKYGFAATLVTVFRGQTVGGLYDGLEFVQRIVPATESFYIWNFIILVVLIVAYRLIVVIGFTTTLRSRKENQ